MEILIQIYCVSQKTMELHGAYDSPLTFILSPLWGERIKVRGGRSGVDSCSIIYAKVNNFLSGDLIIDF